MKFTTAYTPVTTAFAGMADEELDEFYRWFMLNLPYCIEELMQLVRSTVGFHDWYANDSPDSLNTLGNWFALKIKSDLAQSNIAAESNWTDETKSLAVYIGMYYGEVAVKSNSMLEWSQLRGDRKFADFGQPIIIGKGLMPINPVRVAHSFVCGIIDGSRTGNRLRETFDYWMGNV